MTLLWSIAIAALFGCGAYLMLKRDLVRLIAGMVLIGNAANMFIMATALRTGKADILPTDGPSADAMVQAMVLTAIVISFATTTLALVLVYRVYTSHSSVDIERISHAEEQQATMDEPTAGDMHEQAERDEPDDIEAEGQGKGRE